MNRSRRNNIGKNFVQGGVYDGRQQQQQQYQQYHQNFKANQQQSEQQQPQTPVRQQPVKAKPQVQQQQVAQQPQVQQQPQEEEEVEAPPPPTLAQNEMDHIMDDDDAEEEQSEGFTNEKGKPLFKRIFGDRKKSSIRTREKKIRQNRRLRKSITPKNALMALNEVKGIQMSDFTVNSNPSGGFLAIVNINNTQYEGRGPSKAASKNNACEQALRDYVIAKMKSKPRLTKANSENSVVAMEDDAASNGGTDTSKDPNAEDDDVPMVNLASFALFKLFSEWEAEGFKIPEMRRSAPNGGDANSENGAAPQPKKPPTIRNELPDDWETMHPSTLLCMMRPGLTYQDMGAVGTKPNETQNVSVTVDGQEFTGSGRSKKLARRNAAVAVCNALFGTNFVLEGLVVST